MRKREQMSITAIYSILHLLVDGVCALAMFGIFIPEEDGYFLILVYNFCAFALQMPLGILLDALSGRAERKGWRMDPAFLTAAAGVLLTVIGASVHPALLGTGNALFHVGGGVGCIGEDDARSWKGVGLGVFVAPGAVGLSLGTLLAKKGLWWPWYLGGSVAMAILCAAAWGVGQRRGRAKAEAETKKVCRARGSAGDEAEAGRMRRTGNSTEDRAAARADRARRSAGDGAGRGLHRDIVLLAAICLLVVILRSYIGMAVTFPWKTGTGMGILTVLAVAGGKAAGGLCAAKCGARRTVAVSLSLAGVCYLFSAAALPGFSAVFLFNMTMPITLYWLVRSMPGMPGFAFGLLTFGLFLGFLPGYFGLVPETGSGIVGCAGSGLSLTLLLWAERRRGCRHIC